MDTSSEGQEPTGQDIASLSRQLQQIQERLQLIQQATSIGIFEWDIQTGKVTWTREAEERFGLAPGSFEGTVKAWEKLVHPDDVETASANLYRSVEQKTPLDMQFRVVWPDKSVHWMHCKAQTFYDQHGKPLRMLGINMDITAHKKYEHEMKRQEDNFRRFAESNIMGFIFTDAYGHIHYANDAFLDMVGYSRKELEEGKIRWTDITPPEWHEIDEQKALEAQQNGVSSVYEKEYFHKNGSRVSALIGFLLFGEKRDQAIVFILDNTERKRLEQQKDEFMGVVSHELRTPVTSLKAFAQVLEKRFQKVGDQENAELLSKMGAQITKLTRLIEDLIDITKVEAGKLQLHLTDFELMPLVEEVVEEMQRTTTQQILILERIAQEKTQGDRNRIGQVMTNLLSNALKYSPQGKQIIVRVSSNGVQVIVSIQDFGIGIPAEQQEHIFQRFYRADEKKLETIPGLGLGLYISAEMIKRQSGRMWFQSEAGVGSTFFFSVPLSRSDYACQTSEQRGSA